MVSQVYSTSVRRFLMASICNCLEFFDGFEFFDGLTGLRDLGFDGLIGLTDPSFDVLTGLTDLSFDVFKGLSLSDLDVSIRFLLQFFHTTGSLDRDTLLGFPVQSFRGMRHIVGSLN